LRKGGVVAINAIHLDRMPEFTTIRCCGVSVRSAASPT
jgi:hypothetical protein